MERLQEYQAAPTEAPLPVLNSDLASRCRGGAVLICIRGRVPPQDEALARTTELWCRSDAASAAQGRSGVRHVASESALIRRQGQPRVPELRGLPLHDRVTKGSRSPSPILRRDIVQTEAPTQRAVAQEDVQAPAVLRDLEAHAAVAALLGLVGIQAMPGEDRLRRARRRTLKRVADFDDHAARPLHCRRCDAAATSRGGAVVQGCGLSEAPPEGGPSLLVSGATPRHRGPAPTGGPGRTAAALT
mmetsp:Transcript_15710/g.45360  ORF Transcript_15710/g.45360 Transcript_15710/m.45360 type:complete len:245 (-) Transcript_15710:1316-2050(-)